MLDVSCFSEHCLIEKQKPWTLNNVNWLLTLLKCNCGGTCIFVPGDLYINEVKYPKDLRREKEFEMSAVGLVDFKGILICIYRFPHTNMYRFLEKWETQNGKVQSKRNKFLLCGDRNINFVKIMCNYKLYTVCYHII